MCSGDDRMAITGISRKDKKIARDEWDRSKTTLVRVPLFLFILSIIFLTIPAVQAATPDYTALKNDYIKNHPGQSIIPYPWEPTSSTKVLPVNYLVPAAPANNFSITACPGE